MCPKIPSFCKYWVFEKNLRGPKWNEWRRPPPHCTCLCAILANSGLLVVGDDHHQNSPKTTYDAALPYKDAHIIVKVDDHSFAWIQWPSTLPSLLQEIMFKTPYMNDNRICLMWSTTSMRTPPTTKLRCGASCLQQALTKEHLQTMRA